MNSILIFVLVVTLLTADAAIFYLVGVTYSTAQTIKRLREKGWKIEPPENG